MGLRNHTFILLAITPDNQPQWYTLSSLTVFTTYKSENERCLVFNPLSACCVQMKWNSIAWNISRYIKETITGCLLCLNGFMIAICIVFINPGHSFGNWLPCPNNHLWNTIQTHSYEFLTLPYQLLEVKPLLLGLQILARFDSYASLCVRIFIFLHFRASNGEIEIRKHLTEYHILQEYPF